MASSPVHYFKLNTGAKIPSVGLGTWEWDAQPNVVGQAVETAIRVGYRHIDCALIYQNEKEIGGVLKKLFDEGVVKREELWITSKLWNTDHAPEDVPTAFEKTLNDLQLDYLDLYLIHFPVRQKKGVPMTEPDAFMQVDLIATWKAMESIFDSGKARAIGVSNFSSKKLSDLLEKSRVPPAVNQVECHPLWRQTKLRKFCDEKGIHLSGYSPLGSPGTAYMKAAGDVLNHPVVTEIAEKLGKSPAQIALRWGIQMGHSVVPKSTKEKRIIENLNVFEWEIPDDLFVKFDEIPQKRLAPYHQYIGENGAYKNVQQLWDGEL